jgi:hypothetical protein
MSEKVRRAAPEDSADIADMIRGLAEFERAPQQCTVTETQISTALFGSSPIVVGGVELERQCHCAVPRSRRATAARVDHLSAVRPATG